MGPVVHRIVARWAISYAYAGQMSRSVVERSLACSWPCSQIRHRALELPEPLVHEDISAGGLTADELLVTRAVFFLCTRFDWLLVKVSFDC